MLTGAMKSATHKGACQICGSTQMLPDGVLAKHGYTVRWGFFSGTCSGSGRLPFEQSTDAIAEAIAHVKKQIASTKAEILRYEDLSDPVNDGTKVWVHVYAGGYQWVKAQLHDFVVNAEYGRPLYSCRYTTVEPVRTRRDMKPLTDRVEAYDQAWQLASVPEWARFLNRKYATAVLAKANTSRQVWLKWQAERVATWAPKPLTPR